MLITRFATFSILCFAAIGLSIGHAADDSDSSEHRAAEVSVTRRTSGVPRYHYNRPEWSFEVAATSKAFTGNNLLNLAGGSAYAISFQTEYQPKFVQSLGVIGFGPSLSVYPIWTEGVTNSKLDIWSAGGQVRYQARFFREQIIVPMAGYSFERIAYNFQNGIKGSLNAKGAVFGFYLLLNPFDPSAAADFFVNTGVTRSYLIAEYRDLRGSSSDLSLSKGTAYLGIRLEM